MVRVWMLVVCWLVLAVTAAAGKTPYLGEEGLKREAQAGFEQILELWRDGRYEEIWERTTGGSLSKEEFVDRLAGASRKPACCWAKLQEVKVQVKGDGVVVLRGKVGLEVVGTTEFRTKQFRLVKEDGVWRAATSDILSLSGAKKKAKRHRTKHAVTTVH